jgi:hypothetical protein
MIALLDPQIIIGDHHVIPAHDGANDRAWRKLTDKKFISDVERLFQPSPFFL